MDADCRAAGPRIEAHADSNGLPPRPPPPPFRSTLMPITIEWGPSASLPGESPGRVRVIPSPEDSLRSAIDRCRAERPELLAAEALKFGYRVDATTISSALDRDPELAAHLEPTGLPLGRVGIHIEPHAWDRLIAAAYRDPGAEPFPARGSLELSIDATQHERRGEGTARRLSPEEVQERCRAELPELIAREARERGHRVAPGQVAHALRSEPDLSVALDPWPLDADRVGIRIDSRAWNCLVASAYLAPPEQIRTPRRTTAQRLAEEDLARRERAVTNLNPRGPDRGPRR